MSEMMVPVLIDRPSWVMELGLYGRAAYEWRRAQWLLGTLDEVSDPVAMFRSIDRAVGDTVRQTVQRWLQARTEATGVEVAGLPAVFAVDEQDQLLGATQAAEIRPCLDLVYQPALPAPGAVMGQTRPSRSEAELLATTSWETRPSMGDLRAAAVELAEAILDEEMDGEPWSAEVVRASSAHCWLIEPTALFPTEIRVGTQALAARLDRPVDLYLMFN
jgi:hypothetical protein